MCSSLFIAAVAIAGATAEPDDATWSSESNGLQARLVMRRSSIFNGTAIITTYLELKNVGAVANPLVLKSHPLKFTAIDTEGHDAPMPMILSFDSMWVEVPPLVLPHDSQLRFRIGPTGFGVGADKAASLDLGSGFYREFPHDGKTYYLQAILELPSQKDDRMGSAIVWHGKLQLPRVRIPTEPDSIDSSTIGPRIEELGPKMLGSNSDVSGCAANELSLIDDPRVIPWYIKAVKSDSYSLKFAALDRLSRMTGEEAFEGLKIGMNTQGSDIGHCASKQVAEDSAVGIRVSAAYALARSPHPQAKSLLWTLGSDPASSVRLIVVQTAAGIDTPEALAILQRGTHDADRMVRDQANGFLKDLLKPK